LETLVYLASAFWVGAVHAATPGHGKTIAAAYIVGARGKPIDAVILGIFVTLSHTSGIVLVGILASMGSSYLVPQRIEAWLALLTGALVVVLGLWTLWTQKELWGPAWRGEGVGGARAAYTPHQGHSHNHAHDHSHDHEHGPHTHTHGESEMGWHSHGWGIKHTHALPSLSDKKMSLWVLIGLGIAGGLLPDPAALAILLSALAQGKVMLGLGTVVVFSIGFAATLVVVGIVAAKVGQKVLDWLSGAWPVRIQVGTSLIIVAVGVVLTLNAFSTLSRLQ
jgi:nickel/cobalt transporter (NicO) family protein